MALELNGTTGVNLVQDGTVSTDDLANGAVTAGKLASTLDLTGKTVTLPAGVGGKVLQVVQTVKTDVFSASVGAGGISGEITGFTASLTPSSASNKILVMASISTGANDILNGCLLYRGGSVLDAATGAADGNKRRTTSGNRPTGPEVNSMPVWYLDSPNTTSSVTYSFVLANGSAATQTIYVNRASSETNDTTRFRGISSIILMEIAA